MASGSPPASTNIHPPRTVILGLYHKFIDATLVSGSLPRRCSRSMAETNRGAFRIRDSELGWDCIGRLDSMKSASFAAALLPDPSCCICEMR